MRTLVAPADVPIIMTLYPYGAVRAVEPLGGMSNTSFKVTTESRTVTLRLLTPGHNPQGHIALEVEVLQHLAARRFPAPRLLAGEDGALLQHWHEFTLTASDYIDGVTADSLPLTPAICDGAGRLLAEFQLSMRDFFPTISERGGSFNLTQEADANSLAQLAASKGIVLDAAQLLAQWERASISFKAKTNVLQAGWLHADYWPPNLICHNGQVVALIDFDNCCYGTSLVDVAVGLLEFAMPRATVLNAGFARAFLRGYLQAGGNATDLGPEGIVEAMEMACALWVYWEIIELPALVEGWTCLKRLAVFDEVKARSEFASALADCIARANDFPVG